MPNLRKLNLSNNKFENLNDMPDLPQLEVLNLSSNKLAAKDCIFALAKYPTLREVDFSGNPFADELADGLKMELLVEVPELKLLKTVGEDEVTEDDVNAAKETREERIKAKREAEEEAARAAAEAAANAAEGGEAAAE